MRFEIRFGGAFVILVGLFTLSGAVFLLGLYAGYQMARQNQPAVNQVSSTYPLPSAPPGSAPPAASTPPESSSPAVASGASAARMKPIAPRAAASIAPVIAAPVVPAPHATAGAIARAKPPAIAPAVRPPPADTDEDEDDSDAADTAADRPVAPTTSSLKPGHKPFNIQIEAVMDKSGADEMVTRLRGLGYNAQESTTSLEGKTWYRVRVGPYSSEDEARAADQKLRDQYKHAFAPH